MPLPVNDDRTSVNGDEELKSDSSNHAESTGGGHEVPHAVMVADRAQKVVSFPAVVHGQNDDFRWRGWLEMEASDMRSRTQLVAWPNFGKIERDGDRLSRGKEDGRAIINMSRASNRYLAQLKRWPEF